MNYEICIAPIALLLLFFLMLFLSRHQQEKYGAVLREQVTALGGQNIKIRSITPFGARNFMKYSAQYEHSGQQYDHIVLRELSFWGQTVAVHWNPPLPSPPQKTDEKGNEP